MLFPFFHVWYQYARQPRQATQQGESKMAKSLAIVTRPATVTRRAADGKFAPKPAPTPAESFQQAFNGMCALFQQACVAFEAHQKAQAGK